jgi:hypothetical protein
VSDDDNSDAAALRAEVEALRAAVEALRAENDRLRAEAEGAQVVLNHYVREAREIRGGRLRDPSSTAATASSPAARHRSARAARRERRGAHPHGWPAAAVGDDLPRGVGR